MSAKTYDFVAIGLGPFNLGLAALAEPIEGLSGLVLDENPGFDWHPGMMLEDATLQTPFLSDLVTLADPTHRLSFLNYLKQHGRLYPFYIRESFFMLRREYNRYCQWAAGELSNVVFNRRVTSISHEPDSGSYRLAATDPRSGESHEYRARHLVLGTGPKPYLPPAAKALKVGDCHAAHYLDNKAELQQKRSITVVGSGQSAAEIFYDLLSDIDNHGYQLHWLTRSPRFFPLEYTKLTLEMTSPEYVDYFHALPAAQRDQLNARQKHLYKGINGELINAIHELLYSKSLDGPLPVRLLTNSSLQHIETRATAQDMLLHCHHHEQARDFALPSEGLVLATGYQYQTPNFLAGIRERLAFDEHGRFDVRRNYAIDRAGQEVFVQNAELHTHGFVTPDLGMACYRNASLIRAITGVEYYPIETRIAFQEFGAPADLQAARARLAS